jgi:DNA-binding NarL/FixJ family response regulator
VFVREKPMNAGAFGYLSKASTPDLLANAVRTVAAGGRYMSPDVQLAMTTQSATARQRIAADFDRAAIRIDRARLAAAMPSIRTRGSIAKRPTACETSPF